MKFYYSDYLLLLRLSSNNSCNEVAMEQNLHVVKFLYHIIQNQSLLILNAYHPANLIEKRSKECKNRKIRYNKKKKRGKTEYRYKKGKNKDSWRKKTISFEKNNLRTIKNPSSCLNVFF